MLSFAGFANRLTANSGCPVSRQLGGGTPPRLPRLPNAAATLNSLALSPALAESIARFAAQMVLDE